MCMHEDEITRVYYFDYYNPFFSAEFSHGAVMTHRPLKPNERFEVCLDNKSKRWAGSIEVGVTTRHPNEMKFPATMTDLKGDIWVMSGKEIRKGGKTLTQNYGDDLDKLKVCKVEKNC